MIVSGHFILAFHQRSGGALERVLAALGCRFAVLGDLGMLPSRLRQLDPDLVLLPYRGESLQPLLRLVREDSPLAAVVLLAPRNHLASAITVEGVAAVVESEPELDDRRLREVTRSILHDRAVAGTVLVVEDAALILEMTCDVLHAKGYRALRASSAEEGLELALSVQPDVILMDIHLPVQSGLEALEELKRNPETAAIPVVMLSANGTEVSVGEALDRGAIDFLVKPFSPRVLIEKVAHVVAKRDLLVHA